MGALLLLFVVLLNRRTVWLTMIIGIAVLMTGGRRLRRRAVAMVVGAVLVTVAAYVALGGTRGEEPVARSALGTGTLDWRIQGWSELLSGLSNGPAQWLVGEPLGSGFAREVQGSEVQGGATQLLRHDPAADRRGRPAGAHRAQLRVAAGAVADPGAGLVVAC